MASSQSGSHSDKDEAKNNLTASILSGKDLSELQNVLEEVEKRRGVLVRLSDIMGGAVGHMMQWGAQGLSMAPAMQERIRRIAQIALARAFDVAVLGIKAPKEALEGHKPKKRAWKQPLTHAAVVASGAVGGFVGAAGLIPDIGFTTLTIMREIARIAKEEGEDLSDPETRRACLEVFAMRSFEDRKQVNSEREIGFFSARALLRGRPIALLMAEVAGHYGLALSRKVAAQMTPVAGALCGASLNAAFLAHYKALAKAHFVIRRLEREKGELARQAAQSVYTGVQRKEEEPAGKDTPFS